MEKHIETHKAVKDRTVKWVAGKYTDYPEGQDLFGKMYFTAKFGGLIGSCCGIIAMKMRPRPVLLSDKVARWTRFLIPGLGMGVVFSSVVYYSVRIRGKDDALNYVLGGAAAGSMVGLTRITPGFSVFGALGGATLGFIQKTAELHDTQIFVPFRRKEFSSYYQTKLCYSLMEDKRGNWTMEPKTN